MLANLVRSLGLLAVLAAPSLAYAMTFERLNIGPCAARQCALAKGTIDKASVDQFKTFVRAAGLTEGAIIFLDSPGGSHVAGIALGREIRKRGLNTFVSSYSPAKGASFIDADCASACVSMFLGGVQRGVGPRSRLGVHQLSLSGESSASGETSVTAGVVNAQWYMGLAAEHIAEMGADPKLSSMALMTPSAGVYWISRQEMRATRAITLDTGLDKPADNLGAISFFDATR